MWDIIVVRFSEIALKGKNKRDFENALVNNIKLSLGKDFKVKKIFGRFIIFPEKEDWNFHEVQKKLEKIFGIVSFSPAKTCEKDFESIKKTACEIATYEKNLGKKTFKVEARRVDKKFPVSVFDIMKEVGAYVLKNIEGLKVDVHNPDFKIEIEIRDELTFLTSQRYAGSGGLPVGTGGKALSLLSGGIDSPVAAWLMMKRGLHTDFLHFTFDAEKTENYKKIIDIAYILKSYNPKGFKLYVASMNDFIRLLIKDDRNKRYRTVLQRRAMVRIAEKISEKYGYQALITGDNIGQVASQTLENLSVISDATKMFILRPLLGFDKLEIINLAIKIGTYEKSIIPEGDVCVYIAPKNPVTKAKLNLVKQMENELEGIDNVLNSIAERVKVFDIS